MEKREKYLVIPAGGSGTRMGAQIPKQFLELEGKPIMLRTLEAFDEAFDDINIIIALPQKHFQTWKDICRQHLFSHPQRIVCGGITRFHSVKNALEVVPDGALVAIHDAVRPFVGKDFLHRLFDLAESFPALVPVEPVTQTVRCLQQSRFPFLSSDDEPSAFGKPAAGPIPQTAEPFFEQIPGMSVDRNLLYAVQTPQIFHSEVLRRAYESLPFRESFTDDASVVEAMGQSVTYTLGDAFNLKITTPQDMEMGKLFLKR